MTFSHCAPLRAVSHNFPGFLCKHLKLLIKVKRWEPLARFSGIPQLIAGVPKLSLAVYPVNISTDEHVPLNMGAGRIFLKGGANSGFSRGGPKIFLQGMANRGFSRVGPLMILQEGPEVVKLHFHHSKLRKQYFCKKFGRKMSNFKILGALAPLPTPIPLQFALAKRLRKITIIYQPTSI